MFQIKFLILLIALCLLINFILFNENTIFILICNIILLFFKKFFIHFNNLFKIFFFSCYEKNENATYYRKRH